MKNLRKIVNQAHKALDEAGIEHALIGGLALGHHGVHRTTKDVDFLVDGTDKNNIKQVLQACGFELDRETQEVLHFRGEVNLDLLLANRTPTKAMLKRASLMKELNIMCLSAEDIIGLKIQAYVNNPKRVLQDKADILAIMQKNANLKWEQIKTHADLFNEWPAIESLRKDYDL